MAPLVSVLMAAYNRAAYLPQAIEGVLAQTTPDWELIVSDNVSTDATGEIALRYARRDSRIRYFRNPDHVSAVENFNLCYRRAHPESRYLALLATDDWWEPTLLGELVAQAERDQRVAVVHADMYLTDPGGMILGKYTDLYPRLPSPGRHRAARELFAGNYINIMAALVNRERWREITRRDDLFDTSLKLTPDYDFWLQLLTRGGVGYFVPRPLAYYRKHADAMTMPVNSIPRLREEVIIFRDRLDGVCPPELEPVRREALSIRLAQLGFELLQAGRADEARTALREAAKATPARRLDLTVATVISSAPLPARLRAGLWQQALALGRATGRVA